MLANGIRLNPEFAESVLLGQADRLLAGQRFAPLFQAVAPPPERISFKYALFDEGSGREFQSEPILNIAGLGASDGGRPFRYFAVPIEFRQRAVIRMEITEVSTFKGELHVSLQGYKIRASPRHADWEHTEVIRPCAPQASYSTTLRMRRSVRAAASRWIRSISMNPASPTRRSLGGVWCWARFELRPQHCGVLEYIAQFTDLFACDCKQIETAGIEWAILENNRPLYPYLGLRWILNPWGYGSFPVAIRLSENAVVEFVVRGIGGLAGGPKVKRIGGRILGGSGTTRSMVMLLQAPAILNEPRVPVRSGTAFRVNSPPANALVTPELASELHRVLDRFAVEAGAGERQPVRIFFKPGIFGHHQVGRAADIYAVNALGLDKWKLRSG